jgi:hypothetical protein
LFWEYLALSGFVAVVAVALTFMLMNVDYSDSCDTSATTLKDADTLGYTPYMYGAICDNFVWKECVSPSSLFSRPLYSSLEASRSSSEGRPSRAFARRGGACRHARAVAHTHVLRAPPSLPPSLPLLLSPLDARYTAGLWTAICFIIGAVFSATAGFAGMYIATKANTRTAIAANHEKLGFQNGLAVAFGSGAVMSFSVIALGLSGVSFLYCIFAHVSRDHVWDYVSGFGAGGSAIALFARVGGGIYTKAADCGADLVGKVEAGFDEDSPHNPAVIADNIGDNVGDVAGMGADLFESYVGSIIAAAAIGNNVSELRKMYPLIDTLKEGDATAETIQSWRNNAQALPFWIAGCGVFASVIGVFCTRAWPCLLRPVMEEKGGCSFMYRYISRESCSQFDSLPLTSLTIFLTRLDRRRRRHVRRHHAALEQGHGASLYEGRGWACVAHPLLGEQKDSGASGVLLHGARRGTRRERSALRRR